MVSKLICTLKLTHDITHYINMNLKRIDDLPLNLQKLFVEMKTEKDAIEASESDYCKTKNVLDESDPLDVLDDDQQDDYDEYDENTFDMNCVSPQLRDIFDD